MEKRKIQIIPAINAGTIEEIKEKIEIIKPYSKWAHLDAADGTMTKNTIWHNPKDLLEINSDMLIEVHLMLGDIDKRITDWLYPNIKRIIFHLETSKDPDFVAEQYKKAGKEVGIALAPQTSWIKLVPYLRKPKIDLIQNLSVYPGVSGQEFQEDCLDKIKHLKEWCPECLMEVDGGMKVGVVKKAAQAGADIICASSAIFSKKDIAKAIKDLENDAEGP